jgi:hypothetical protein
MTQARKPGRPQEWALDEEITQVYRIAAELKTQNPHAHWSEIKDMMKNQFEEKGKKNLLSKLDKITGLVKQVIPLPPRCICGGRVYSFTFSKVENENEHYWEIFARCTNQNCRYLRRYLPDTTYKWSRPASIIKELAKIPTFYEMDGQLVEEPRR